MAPKGTVYAWQIGLGASPIFIRHRIGLVVAVGLGPLAFVWTCVDACRGGGDGVGAVVQIFSVPAGVEVAACSDSNTCLQYLFARGAQRASPVPLGVVDACTRGGTRCNIAVENDAMYRMQCPIHGGWIDGDANDVDTRKRVVGQDRHSHRISLVTRNHKTH